MPDLTMSDVRALILTAEQWADRVRPHLADMPETQSAWRLGFAAAMQRIEILAEAATRDEQ